MPNTSVFCRVVLLAAVTYAVGCTQSFPTAYVPGQGISLVTPPKSGSIAIARFEDKRSFAQRNDKKAGSFIATQSPWMFGLTHKGRQYIPVSELVQDLFVTEFQTAGLKAISSDVATSDPIALREAAVRAQADYALGGQILVFEFANDAGVWTVTSRRTVTLSITLVPSDGDVVLTNSAFTQSDAENEGMAVLHTTNVEKLMNVTFKNVLNQVIVAVSAKLAMMPSEIDVNVFVAGRLYRVKGDALRT